MTDTTHDIFGDDHTTAPASNSTASFKQTIDAINRACLWIGGIALAALILAAALGA